MENRCPFYDTRNRCVYDHYHTSLTSDITKSDLSTPRPCKPGKYVTFNACQDEAKRQEGEKVVDLSGSSFSNREVFYLPSCENQWRGYQAGCYKNPDGILEKGHRYTISKVCVHAWHTEVWLDGIDDGPFNSVMFKNDDRRTGPADRRGPQIHYLVRYRDAKPPRYPEHDRRYSTGRRATDK